MEHMLEHAHLSDSARKFLLTVIPEYSGTFRSREILWQLKLMSRYSAERSFFESALQKKQQELSLVLPHVRLALVPPPRSTPLSRWHGLGVEWPDPVALVTQVFLQQILSSSELFLDLGSRTDSFFLSEKKEFVGWVPESAGTRWHEPFRTELARLYLGWAFDQERLVEMALQSLHLSPLAAEIVQILSHWREPVRCSPESLMSRFKSLFQCAQTLGLHLHPNILVWALYELEIVEVLSALDVAPNLEHTADELCRLHSRMSA